MYKESMFCMFLWMLHLTCYFQKNGLLLNYNDPSAFVGMGSHYREHIVAFSGLR